MSGKKKKITLKLEFYLGGKSLKPQVAFIGVGDYGVPLTPHLYVHTQDGSDDAEKQNAAFDAFSKAAYEYCRAMKEAGELA